MDKNHKNLLFAIPISLLFVGIIVPGILLFLAVIHPLMNVKDVEINERNSVYLVEDSWIALYIEDEGLETYEVRVVNDAYLLSYTTARGVFSIEIEVTRLEHENAFSGFFLHVYDPVTEAYTVDEFTNFADIYITEPGTYEVAYSSFDDIDESFGIQYSNYNDVGVKITIATIIFFLSIGSSIGSFIYLIKKYRKTVVIENVESDGSIDSQNIETEKSSK